jgi:hypothetical protein
MPPTRTKKKNSTPQGVQKPKASANRNAATTVTAAANAGKSASAPPELGEPKRVVKPVGKGTSVAYFEDSLHNWEE